MESLPAHPWLPLSFLMSSHLHFYSVCFEGMRIRLCHRWNRHRRGRWRMSWCRCLFEKMPRVSSIRFPSSRVHLQNGLARCTASVLACARDGDDLDGGLHFYSRLGQGVGPSSSVRRGPAGAAGAKSPSTPSPLTADRVERMHHRLAEIHAIAAMQLVECAHWRWTDSTPCSI
jgi:hypothetical protein